MKKHVYVKRFVVVLLTLAFVLAGGSTAFAKQDNSKDNGKDTMNLSITNIPVNQTITVGTKWDFDADVNASNKGQSEKGIIRWEIINDTAGVGAISNDGVVTPTKKGSFQIRALNFQNENKYNSWLDNKLKNEKSISGISEWLTITAEEINLVSIPTITLNGNQAIFLHVGDTYIDPGVTAFDRIDGDISGKVVLIYSTVDMNHAGYYNQLYMVVNSTGNISYAERYVIVAEPNTPMAPIFIFNSYNNPQLVQIGSAYVPIKLLAFDDKDGNISDKVIIGGDTVNTNVEGIYTVTYDVKDSDGLSAAGLTIKVIVTDLNNPMDYTEPSIQLFGDYYMYLDLGDTFTEPGYMAIDDRDGDITGSVLVEGNVDTSVSGLYTLTYKVADSYGNEAVGYRYIQVGP